MLAALAIVLTFFAMVLRLIHEHADVQWWLIAISVILVAVEVLLTRGPRFWEWRRRTTAP